MAKALLVTSRCQRNVKSYILIGTEKLLYLNMFWYNRFFSLIDALAFINGVYFFFIQPKRWKLLFMADFKDSHKNFFDLSVFLLWESVQMFVNSGFSQFIF